MSTTVVFGKFEWDAAKEKQNIQKHRLDFYTSALVFLDPFRRVAVDEKHSLNEERFFCVGKVGRRVITVRFTLRKDRVRIFGAGYWREGRQLYEEQTKRSK